MISDQELLALNKRGLIPGPDEDEAAFLERISPFLSSQPIPIPQLDIAPDWITLTYSNKNLSFFQGAATWIENKHPTIQLRSEFAKGSYLIYHPEEIIAHEAAHACRMAFEEPRFEEIFAYSTSPNRFRRFFGPLFRTTTESTLFLISCLLSLTAPIFDSFLPLLLPLLLLTLFTFRLLHSHHTLNRCLKNIQALTHNPSLTYGAAYRMTDHEIALFARHPSSIATQPPSLRWRLICLAYF